MNPQSIIEAEIQVLLAKRGMRRIDLERKLGVSPSALGKIFQGNRVCSGLRRNVELFFNQPLWNSAEEFAQINQIKAFLGVDPILSNLCILTHAVRQKGLWSNVGSIYKSQLIANLAAYLNETEPT